jgi:hypothetical protein
MSRIGHAAADGYGLRPAGDEAGLNLGPDGPRLGPIALLSKTPTGYAPRPAAELDIILTYALGRPTSSESLAGSLRVIARALNDKDESRATIATQQMRLPPLSSDEAARARMIDDLVKASPDDPRHPGWPRGAPNGQGGQFRPKDAAGDAAEGEQDNLTNLAAGREEIAAVQKQLEKAITRRVLKAAIRLALKPGRLGRLAVEMLSNFIPVVDAVGDAAMIADVAQTGVEAAQVLQDAKVALEFVKKGPQDLESLMVGQEGRAFDNFSDFKKLDTVDMTDLEKFYGPAKKGYEYHHIVEQGGMSQGLSERELNSTRNIIEIPKFLHEEISAEFSRIARTAPGRVTNRADISSRAFNEQYERGVNIMRRLHIIK